MEDLLFKGELKNSTLDELIKNVKKDKSTGNTAKVLEEAERCTFLIPVTIKDGNYNLNVMGSGDGKQYLCAYTDSEKTGGTDTVTTSFYDLADLMNDGRFTLDGIILNPGTDDLILGAELLIKMVEQTDDSIRVGEPNMYPPELKGKITEFCRDQESIEEVYVRFFVKKKSGDKGWLFVIKSDLSDDQKQYVYEMFRHFVEPSLEGISALILDHSLDYAGSAIKGCDPYYTKVSEC